MVNAIWGLMVVLALLYGIIGPSPEALGNALTAGAQDAVMLLIKMVGGFMLWNGLFEIVSESGLAAQIGKALKGAFKKLFPGLKNDETLTMMTMNMTMNMLGLGNAATPMGLRAMEALSREQGGGDTAGDAMVLFLVLNASSLQLLPATVMTLRQAAGSGDPGAVILPTLFATGVSTLAGVLACLVFRRWRLFK